MGSFEAGARVYSPDMSSRAYRLKTDEAAAEGVRRIALGRAEKALERLDGPGEADLAVAVHGARKDLKKLRALLRLVRDELGKKTFRAENRRYRDAGRLLAGSRDAEVKLETLLELRHRLRRSSAGAGRALGRECSRRSGTSWPPPCARRPGAGSPRRSRRSRPAASAIRRVVAADRLLGAGGTGAVDGATGDGRRGDEASRSRSPRAENVHEWRKRAKDLWYQLRIVAATPGRSCSGATVEQAHELTDLLGDHHDLAVLAEDLRSRNDLGDRGAFETAIARAPGRAARRARSAIGRRLYAEKPKAFRRRLERYWLAWREA